MLWRVFLRERRLLRGTPEGAFEMQQARGQYLAYSGRKVLREPLRPKRGLVYREFGGETSAKSVSGAEIRNTKIRMISETWHTP
jgi:hypothetical protein